MAKRLFVGGLPYTLTSSELEELFSKVGTVVSATVITDKFSGQSKGFGFVEMSSDEEAEKAIKELTDTEVGGRKIVVNEARPMEERAPRNFDSRGGGAGRGGDNKRRSFGGNRRGGGGGGFGGGGGRY